MKQQIDFQASPHSLDELGEMVDAVFAQRDEAKEIDRRDALWFWVPYCLFLLLVAAVFVFAFSRHAYAPYASVSSVVGFMVALIYPAYRKPSKALSRFASEYAAYGSFDLDFHCEAVTRSYLLTAIENSSMERIHAFVDDPAFSQFRAYLAGVLSQRDLTSFEFGQLMAAYEREKAKRSALESTERAQRTKGELLASLGVRKEAEAA